MSRGNGAKSLKLNADDLNEKLYLQNFRKILYFEILEPRYASMHDAKLHFFLLNDNKVKEYIVNYADSVAVYSGIVSYLERFVVADMFRMYRFQTAGFNYRIFIRKGVTLEANNDLGAFVYQGYKTSHLISPMQREVFERMSEELRHTEDGTAQLVRVGRLLKHEKFCEIHEEYFGKIGLAALNDGSTVKYRYADNISNNNVITNEEMFREYLARVNAIPMTDFTTQSIIAQLAEDYHEIKRVIMENYSNFLFLDEDEIEFACILLGLFLHKDSFPLTTENWITSINYIRYQNNDIFLRLDDDEDNMRRELGLSRARYVLEKISLPKLVHFLYDFFDFNNLSRNIGAFYPRINELLGEDIREKFAQLETVNVSLKSFQESKEPCSFFKYPQLVNFATAADKEIQKQILSGEYDHSFVAFYLCNYMQVADYKKFMDVMPAVVSIIKNLKVEKEDDYNLLWMAGDLLNDFWKLIPSEQQDLQDEVEKLIQASFWPRIGDVWPIAHRKEIYYRSEHEAEAFDECLGWLCSINDMSKYDTKFKKYLLECAKGNEFDIKDKIDVKAFCIKMSKQKEHSFYDFMMARGNDESWFRTALYADFINDEEILSEMFNLQSLVIKAESARECYLESWLLKTRDIKSAALLDKYFIGYYDAFDSICEKMTDNVGRKADLLYRSLAAMCESATLDVERKILNEFAQKMMHENSILAQKYEDKIKRILALADANIRRANFQTKNLTPEALQKLY